MVPEMKIGLLQKSVVKPYTKENQIRIIIGVMQIIIPILWQKKDTYMNINTWNY